MKHSKIPWIFIGVVLAATAVAMFFAIRQDGAWHSWCESQGGHVTTHYETTSVTVINPKTGQPQAGTATTSTSYCLTDDGRILGIE